MSSAATSKHYRKRAKPATRLTGRWCRIVLATKPQRSCRGKPLPKTSEAGRKDLCPVHAYLAGDFDE